MKKLPGFNKWWNFRFLNHLGFSNPYKNTGANYTQLTIEGLWQKQEAVRMDFIRTAFFDEPEVVDSPQKSENSTIALADLGLRQLRKVASRLGLQQKIEKKDRSKASFVAELQRLMEDDSNSVLAAVAAIS